LPIVIRDEIEWLAGVDSVAVDMEQGGYDAVKHLLALGHTRIACVTTMLAAGRKLGRLKGYRKALAEMGIAFDETLVRPCGTNLDDGRKVTKEILAMKDRPSAIFLQCDLLAMGAFSAVRQAGLKIPDDISLVGFDDISFAPYLESPLTTVAHPKEKVAAALVKTLAHRIQNKEAAARHIVITPQLIVRKSSARPRDFSSQPKQGVRRPQPCRQ
jgi:DNA-binding LacI/PurR family transcriptional regulator